MQKSRRTFLKTSMSGAVASAFAMEALGNTLSPSKITEPTIIPNNAFGTYDRIRVAVLGVNGRGESHISDVMRQANVEVAALCDLDRNLLETSAKSFEEKYKKKVRIEQDFRKIYDAKDIDAVTLATPNHWHALQTIWACQAGKDVYLEKLATHNISMKVGR